MGFREAKPGFSRRRALSSLAEFGNEQALQNDSLAALAYRDKGLVAEISAHQPRIKSGQMNKKLPEAELTSSLTPFPAQKFWRTGR